MIEFGKTLRAAREAKGLSVANIAEATHMLVRIVEGLENEDFSALPAPIYGRGFVKLYCEQVGLDPKPMIAEFMEIYNGAKDLGIREKTIAPKAPVAEPPPANPDPINLEPVRTEPLIEERPSFNEVSAIPEPPSITAREPELNLFSSSLYSATPAAKNVSPPSRELETPFAGVDPDEPKKFTPASGTSRFSRYASPVSNRYEPAKSFKLPDLAYWRIGVLGASVIGILIAAAAGIRALYRATTEEAPPISETTAAALNNAEIASETTPKCEGVSDNATRTKAKIPSLYITH